MDSLPLPPRPGFLLSPNLGRRPIAATIALAALLSAGGSAMGGVTLLSRDSRVEAAGGDTVSQKSGTSGFDRFANQVGTLDTPVNGITSLAHQYSVPGVVGVGGSGLGGAFGEGQALTQSQPGRPSAHAVSGFEMVFSVDDAPVEYSIGATLGAAGNGNAIVELLPLSVGSTAPVFEVEATSGAKVANAVNQRSAGDARELIDEGTLAPGRYLFRVLADSRDDSGTESNAYFNFNLTLTAADSGTPAPPAAVPLPPAVFAGGAMLLLAGAIVRRSRRQQMIV